jgi:hypothetical protein
MCGHRTLSRIYQAWLLRIGIVIIGSIYRTFIEIVAHVDRIDQCLLLKPSQRGLAGTCPEFWTVGPVSGCEPEILAVPIDPIGRKYIE